MNKRGYGSAIADEWRHSPKHAVGLAGWEIVRPMYDNPPDLLHWSPVGFTDLPSRKVYPHSHITRRWPAPRLSHNIPVLEITGVVSFMGVNFVGRPHASWLRQVELLSEGY